MSDTPGTVHIHTTPEDRALWDEATQKANAFKLSEKDRHLRHPPRNKAGAAPGDYAEDSYWQGDRDRSGCKAHL